MSRIRARNKAHLIAISVAKGWVDGDNLLEDYEDYKASLPDDE
ncbi:hypothetical protein [Erythrobacter aureus]|nr:hypothetical protein [Erythrobacter aureus]